MYEQITRNKRDSWVLVGAVTLLLAALGYVIARAESLPWEYGIGAAAITAMLAGITAYYGGSAMVLGVSLARPIEKADNPRLFNVVEEMAIASGLPVPKVYIIDDTAPNAFATGRSPDAAAIAVTTGLLSKLDRDELQGVIAHEMAHIKNYDTRLLMLLSVLVGGIVLLSDLYWRANRFGGLGGRRRRSSDGGQAQVIFLVLALVLAVLAPFFAKMLEMAVSRRREYLADASAGLITRYPDGLASALEKISADPDPLEAANRATQHLYIVNPVKALSGASMGLFDTHPPIQDRIQRLRGMGLKGSEGARERVGEGASVGFARMPGKQPLVTVAAPAPSPASVSAPEAMMAGPAAGVPLMPPARQMGSVADPARPVAPSPSSTLSPPRPITPSPSPSVPSCPRCQAPLMDGNIRSKRALGCRQCGGVWLGQEDMEALLRESPDDLDAADRRFPNLVGHGWDLVSERRCPMCGETLESYTTEVPARVPLDRCPNGHGLWFDDGELSALAWAARRAGNEA